MSFASQIMSKRIWRDQAVFRFRGCSANWMPLSVRIVWIRYGTAVSSCSRNSHAVRRSALSTKRGDREFAGAVDADGQVKFAFGGLHFRNIDVKEADRIALEALALRLVTLDVRQARDAVPLKASMQR